VRRRSEFRYHILFHIAQQVLLHEQDRRVKLEVGILFFAKSVPFVFADEAPDRRIVFSDRLDHLAGLGNRHSGIVLALYDEKGLRDVFRHVERRGAIEIGAHFGIAFVAVLYAARIALFERDLEDLLRF